MISILVVGLAVVAFGCTEPGGGATTTVATTSSTSSTSSTTINPACGTYTPSGVVLSDPSASADDVITVSGSGPTDGVTIEITMAPVGPGTPSGVLGTAVVSGGAWATAITIPNPITAGSWNVVAKAQGCAATATALITII